MKLKIIDVDNPFSFNKRKRRDTLDISDHTDFIGCIGITCFSGEPYDNND